MGLSAILVCEVFSASVHAWVHVRRPGASVPFGGDCENPRSIWDILRILSQTQESETPDGQ